MNESSPTKPINQQPSGNAYERPVARVFDLYLTGVIGEGGAASPNPVLGWVGSLSEFEGTKGYWAKVDGAFEFKPKNRWWFRPGIITINIGDAINPNMYDEMGIDEL